MLIMLADEANVNIQNMIHNWPYHGGLTEPYGALRSKMLMLPAERAIQNGAIPEIQRRSML